MTFVERVCQYCSHPNAGTESRCGHCGAPLHRLAAAAGRAGEGVVGDTEKAVAGAERVVAGAESVAAGVEKPIATGVEKFVQRYPQHWQWRAAIAGIVATVLGFVFAIVHSCSGALVPSLPDLGASVGASAALPETVRSAASCQQISTAAEQCVILAANPLLAGGITGGRELSLSVTVDPPDRLPANIARWRAAGGTVLADGPVFVAIGPSATVWYANTASGVRIETGSFTGRTGAQTFLSRSGLAR
ncbi:hypothetical protein [Nocardia vinacea]|uniref:hypothetical protein n=1 Tax=Nocardia vinacea TaxID=96468 RepID=UPI0002DE15D2|nr:hypothetical protein [Nocardia vinacea]